MPALTSLASAVESKPDRNRAIRLDLISGGLFLAALWFILCRHLSGEWTFNEQYNYGWFVPFFALLLLWLRWETRPEPEVGGRKSEVRGQKSEVGGRWSVVGGRWSVEGDPATDHRPPITE